MSVIVSRFTTFTENFVICCYQVTKFLCSEYGFACAFPSVSPCKFGPLAHLAISVFWDVNVKTAFSQHLTGSIDDSREELAGASLYSGTLSSTRFSLNSCNHSGKSDNGSPPASSLSSFLLEFGVLVGLGDKSPCACSLTFLLRVVAGRIVEFTESCDDDVGDVGKAELEEPVDKPGTTSGT